MIVAHPALDILLILAKRAQGTYKVLECQKALAYVLRGVVKRKRYECWGVIVLDRGDVPLKDNPEVSIPNIILKPRRILTAPKACPKCGSTDWGYIFGDVFMCNQCYHTYKIKEA